MLYAELIVYLTMKRFVLSLLLMLPLAAVAQDDAVALLDRIIADIKAGAALQQDYSYTVYDEDDAVVYSDKGVLKLDNERYALDMENMKVWCDGITQWSYMKDIDEVYITDAGSEEAQNLSPLYIMEAYRANYTLELGGEQAGIRILAMKAKDVDAEVNELRLHVYMGERPVLEGLEIFMSGQGYARITLGESKRGCKFGKDTYRCRVKDFPTAEIVDMR